VTQEADLKTETVAVPVEGGAMSAHFVLPASGRGPGIVMLQEIFGVNDAMKDKAREFAEHGFVVLVPDLFWRQEPNVDLGYDEASRTKGFKLFQGFDFTKGVAESGQRIATLANRENRDIFAQKQGDYCGKTGNYDEGLGI
jgi:carboxymethylenebutenolidase